MTLNSGAEPGDNRPPVIQDPTVPSPEQGPKPTTRRQPITLLLNLCLVLFLADAIFSLLDDTLALTLHIHLLAGVRGIVGTFALFVAFLVYVLMGFTPLVPKRIFLPVTLFSPVALLLAVPAWIYFYSRAQQVAWLVSLVQLVFGLLILRHIQGGFKVRWPLFRKELVQGRGFSWGNLVGFWALNVLVILPAILAYFAFCSSLAIGHFSDGFVALRRIGFTVQVRKYVRDDGKSILLVPMSHIGEPEFYRSLAKSFPTNSTILMEGVTDDNNLLTNRITYKRMATSLGLAQQQKEFRPSPVQMVFADIDVDQFTPGTISFLNLVMMIHARGPTLENVLQLMQCSEPPNFEEQLFNDILRKRNRHLLQQIHEQFQQSDALVVPWGAAHMPEIAREIQKSGFRLDSAREYVAIRFHHS
jgi:hypothetical protein